MFARTRKCDGQRQTLYSHLTGTSTLAQGYAQKLGLGYCGALLGLLHDLGKGSEAFQDYLVNERIELKGQIDHSTAGAQWLYKYANNKSIAEMLSICLASHHGGLIDVISVDGESVLQDRLNKSACNLDEAVATSPDIINKAVALVQAAEQEIIAKSKDVLAYTNKSPLLISFYMGCLTRFLFSCLVDADHTNSSDFEFQPGSGIRRRTYDWQQFIDVFNQFIAGLTPTKPIDFIRQQVSEQCFNKASNPRGIYTLTVPTGGGKTFSSFRYALNHAQKHGLDRIFYIVPFTSIIDQNVEEIKKIFPADLQEFILEQHSNIDPDNKTWQGNVWRQNWDSPIIFTTMVQFLNTLFDGGTSSAKKMHQLGNSLLVFDEVQALPIKCIHLFCNAINFLVELCGSSILLCTATQPSFGELEKPEKGCLHLAKDHELVQDTTALFQSLERVEVIDKRRQAGWTSNDISSFAKKLYADHGNCLVIVNTRKHAHDLYEQCKNVDGVFHLSTYQCAAHRKDLFKTIRERLKDNLPVLCISTQLIEAGIDVSFNTVIRVLAGLDSIAQAAGRCNRHGLLAKGYVYIVNSSEEALGSLEDIKAGQTQAERVLDENQGKSILSPGVIKSYFKYYYSNRSKHMDYICQDKGGRVYSLLSLLSDNASCPRKKTGMRQAFKKAGEEFKAIEDIPCSTVVVPYNKKGEDFIIELCQMVDDEKFGSKLIEAQQYTVNVTQALWKKLDQRGALAQIGDTGIFHLDIGYYSLKVGICDKIVNSTLLII